MIRWIDTPDVDAAMPVAWRIRRDDPRIDGWAAASVTTGADLADFARHSDAGVRVLRRRCARLLLARAGGCTPAEVILTRTATGAPIVRHPAGWHVSVAGHGADLLIAVATVPLGADIESRPAAAVPPDLLAPGERATLAALAPEARGAASLRCWVAKEAHAKRLGDPRRIAPDGVETAFTGTDGTARCALGTSRLASMQDDRAIAVVALA